MINGDLGVNYLLFYYKYNLYDCEEDVKQTAKMGVAFIKLGT